jgi:hypothetical protein
LRIPNVSPQLRRLIASGKEKNNCKFTEVGKTALQVRECKNKNDPKIWLCALQKSNIQTSISPQALA